MAAFPCPRECLLDDYYILGRVDSAKENKYSWCLRVQCGRAMVVVIVPVSEHPPHSSNCGMQNMRVREIPVDTQVLRRHHCR